MNAQLLLWLLSAICFAIGTFDSRVNWQSAGFFFAVIAFAIA